MNFKKIKKYIFCAILDFRSDFLSQFLTWLSVIPADGKCRRMSDLNKFSLCLFLSGSNAKLYLLIHLA